MNNDGNVNRNGNNVNNDNNAICDFCNLYAAHTKARRGKLHKREVIEFELSLAQNLVRLREEPLSQPTT